MNKLRVLARNLFLPRNLPLGAASAGAVAFIALCIRAVRAKCPIWFDGPILGIQEAIRTGRIYQADALATPPYSALTHPPLSYLLGHPIYMAGGGVVGLRLLNIFFILTCGALVYQIAAGEDRRASRLSAVFAVMVFFLFPPVFRWSQLIRCPDSLSCLFDLCIVLLWTRRLSGAKREVLSGFLFLLAILAKQSAILTFGPVLLYQAIMDRQPVRLTAIRFASALLPLAAFTVAMQWWTHGGFIVNVIYGNVIGANIDTWYGDIVLELGYFWWFALIVLVLTNKDRSLIRVWFLVSVVAGLATDWKDGANSVYFFESSAALAILAGRAFKSVTNDRLDKTWAKAVALAVPLLLILFVNNAYAWRMPDEINARENDRLLSFLRVKKTAGRRVLTQDVSLSLALNEEPLWNDALVLSALARQGRWDDRYIVSELHERRFYAVVGIVDHYWTPAMKKEINEHYCQAGRFGGTLVSTLYVPRETDTNASCTVALRDYYQWLARTMGTSSLRAGEADR